MLSVYVSCLTFLAKRADWAIRGKIRKPGKDN